MTLYSMCLINVRDAFSLFQIKKKQNLGSILQNLSNSESVPPTFLYGLAPLYTVISIKVAFPKALTVVYD